MSESAYEKASDSHSHSNAQPWPKIAVVGAGAVGGYFGGRDHTTVMHAERKIRSLMAERRSIFNQVTELTNRIKQQARSG